MLNDWQIFPSNIVPWNFFIFSLSFISFHTDSLLGWYHWQMFGGRGLRMRRVKRRGSEGRKGCLDKDTIVRMGFTRLLGSALSTHLDNERTGENVRWDDTAFSRGACQNVTWNKRSHRTWDWATRYFSPARTYIFYIIYWYMSSVRFYKIHK